TNKTIMSFQDAQLFAYNKANPSGTGGGGTGGGYYQTAISPYHYTSGAFWAENPLVVYSHCNEEANASFSPSNFTLCFGGSPQLKNFVFSQDPDIIYHETGHAMVNILINSRNRAAG